MAKAVKAGAVTRMPLADQFWGDRYGPAEDPFGNICGIGTHIEDVDDKKLKRRTARWQRTWLKLPRPLPPPA